MEEGTLRTVREGREALAALAELRDGDAALLYAFVSAQERPVTAREAMEKLDLPAERLRKAAELLCVYGLCTRQVLPPPRRETAYSGGELAAARTGDPAFDGLCSYFEAAKGKFLNRREVELLLDLRESLNLPPDVLTLLIGDCAQRGKLTPREVEKQAYRWYDMGLDSYDKAGAFLQRQKERTARGVRILEMFQIRGRLPGETEQGYIDKWAVMGVSDEMLRLAYDKTLVGAGKLSWPYLHKILLSWQQKGIRTPEEAKNEQRTAQKPADAPVRTESAESAILRKMQEKRQQRALVLEQRRAELRQGSSAFAENESALRLCASRMARAAGENRRRMEEDYRQYLAKQDDLLQELGKPADWLTDRPECPKCGDRGYIGTQKCECLLRAVQEASV